MTLNRLTLAAAAPALFLTATPALADRAGDYNLFVLGDFSSSGSDTEGRMAVGGNATLTNYDVGARLPAGATGDTLVVGGTLDFTNGQVSRGNAVAGTLDLDRVSMPGGSARTGTGPVDFAAEAIRLKDLSTTLAARAATGTTAYQYGGVYLTGADSGLNIFTVDASQLFNANNFSLTLPTGAFALVNVTGITGRMQYMGFNLSGIAASNVLLNFGQATNLTFRGVGINASVLAPLATVRFDDGQMNGTLIAANASGSGQYNFVPFAGTLLTAGAVPEPATWAMMIAGFGLVGAAIRRAQRPAAFA